MAAKPGFRTAILLCTVVFIPLARAQEKYGGGYGTAERPYLIFGPRHLNAIGDNPEDWGKHFKLMYHVNLAVDTGTQFHVIGTGPRHSFSGVFDGNGYTIRNLTWESTETSYVGLFGYVSGDAAEIRNLGLINADIDAGAGDYVGVLVGHLDGGTIVDCYIEGGNVTGGRSIGGLVGCNSAAITDCQSIVTVTGTQCVGGLVGHNWGGEITCSCSAGDVSCAAHAGGLVGANASEAAFESFNGTTVETDEANDEGIGVIAECYSTCTVCGESVIGGFVGFNGHVIEDCYAMGDVTGGDCCGGMLGYNDENGSVTNCYSVGQVAGDSSVGGFAGHNEARLMTLCFWDIETSGQSSSSGGHGRNTIQLQSAATFFGWNACTDREIWFIDEGQDYPRLWWEPVSSQTSERTHLTSPFAGSGTAADPLLIVTAEGLNLIGLYPRLWDKHLKLAADIDMADCHNRQFNIIGVDREMAFAGVFDGDGHIVRNLNIGSGEGDWVGFFGCVSGSSAEIKNLGLVDPNVVIDIGSGVGPLAGCLFEGTVSNCFVQGGIVSGDWWAAGLVGENFYGTIENSYSATAVSAYAGAGGLVGYHSGGHLRACYFAGTVADSFYRGALVGMNWGSVIECFWDAESSGWQASSGGKGRTTTDMKQSATFFMWGAYGNEGVWVIDEGRDYPRLWWEGTPGQTIRPVALSDWVSGAGTEGDPFLIETPQQLNLIGRFPCEWDKHFRLMADADLSGYAGAEFNVIGAVGIPFTGTFDGGGHIIYGLSHISRYRASVGLFGEIWGAEAEVRDLGLAEAYVSAHGSQAGILAGYVGSGNIRNCHVDGGRVHNHNSATGGLVGGTGSGVLTDCYAKVDITSYGADTGGLVGRNRGVLRNCCSSGHIRSYDFQAGGLAGFNTGEIINCYSEVDVEGQDHTGGLVGDNTQGFVANSYASGAVTGSAHTGGLVGHMSYAEVVGSFWDRQTSGQDTSAAGKRLSTRQMMTMQPFLNAGWDFIGETANGTDDIWWMDEGQDYPRLWWEAIE